MSERLTARLKSGNVDVEQHEHGFWLVGWYPDEGHPDHPGHTYSPKDPDLPSDYPGGDDPDKLLEWGKRRWANA